MTVRVPHEAFRSSFRIDRTKLQLASWLQRRERRLMLDRNHWTGPRHGDHRMVLRATRIDVSEPHKVE